MARAVPAAVLAITVDPSVITAVVVDRTNATRHRVSGPTPSAGTRGGGAVIEAIRGMARAAMREAGPVEVVGASVVVPGAVDSTQGIACHCSEFGWHNVALARLITDDIDVPVALEQDVRAAALAEGAVGAARATPDWLYLSVGATISGAAVVAGELQRGATGAAGEVGHLPVYPFGEQCTCGQRGCVQAYASTLGLLARYAQVSGTVLELAAMAELAGHDPLADEVWAQGAAALGLGLTMYTMMADPGLIVLGGELATVADTVLPLLRADLGSRLKWRPAPRIVAARLGASAASLGAIQLAWPVGSAS